MRNCCYLQRTELFPAMSWPHRIILPPYYLPGSTSFPTCFTPPTAGSGSAGPFALAVAAAGPPEPPAPPGGPCFPFLILLHSTPSAHSRAANVSPSPQRKILVQA